MSVTILHHKTSNCKSLGREKLFIVNRNKEIKENEKKLGSLFPLVLCLSEIELMNELFCYVATHSEIYGSDLSIPLWPGQAYTRMTKRNFN